MLSPGLVDRTALIVGGNEAVADTMDLRFTEAGMRVVRETSGGDEPRTDGWRARGLDALILNPGASWRDEPDAWRECLRVTYDSTQAVLPQMRGDGHILACGPPVVAAPGPGYAAYVKARLAIARFVREVAAEHGDTGIAAVGFWPSSPLNNPERVVLFCDGLLDVLSTAPRAITGRHVIDLEIAHQAAARADAAPRTR